MAVQRLHLLPREDAEPGLPLRREQGGVAGLGLVRGHVAAEPAQHAQAAHHVDPGVQRASPVPYLRRHGGDVRHGHERGVVCGQHPAFVQSLDGRADPGELPPAVLDRGLGVDVGVLPYVLVHRLGEPAMSGFRCHGDGVAERADKGWQWNRYGNERAYGERKGVGRAESSARPG